MGIKGVGMATLAIIAKQSGFIVGGSDVEEEFITDRVLREAGIEIRVGFKEENVKDFFGTNTKNECLMITTAAHKGFENPEAVFANENDYKVISHGEAVGVFMAGKIFGREGIEGISISGSHGKTTITGMLACILMKLGFDPSFTAGTSEIFPTGAAGHFGKGKYFIAEADEYLAETKFDRTPKFLYQKPRFLIINNIDFDHPDFYRDLEEVKNAYSKFLSNLPSDGVLIVNGDDENIRKIIDVQKELAKIITYGTSDTNDFKITNYRHEGLDSHFDIVRDDTLLGNFSLSIPGYHNAKNSLSVVALLVELGISISQIQKALPEFKGVKRRLEEIGKTADGVLIFDDYAHHPEEIRKTLAALKEAFNKRITIVFQAHTFSRTKALLSEFASAFSSADELILLPTFSSSRDEVSESGRDDEIFLEEIRKIKANVKLIEKSSDVVEYINKNIKNQENLVVTMGAGDVYKIAYRLINL